jgi:demethylmenaquinone methyltransferase / 2-methoxy-6-polyprenyl-1,4-benzoquinol methylase
VSDVLSPRTRHARALFAGLPSSYEWLGAFTSFGQDPRWRRFMISRLDVDPAARVLDVATGTSAVAREVVRRTRASVVGLDQSEQMVRQGRGRVERAGMGDRVSFVLGQAERLPFPDSSFEALTFAYLLRYVDDVGGTLRELARVVRPGGAMAGLEFHVPWGRVRHPLWLAYTRGVMPVAGRVVSRAWWDAFRFLGPSISEFYRLVPLEEQLALWRIAGISDARARVMSFGGGVVVWGTKAGVERIEDEQLGR